MLASSLGDGILTYTSRLGDAVPEWDALGAALCLAAALCMLVVALKVPVAVTIASVIESDERALTTEPHVQDLEPAAAAAAARDDAALTNSAKPGDHDVSANNKSASHEADGHDDDDGDDHDVQPHKDSDTPSHTQPVNGSDDNGSDRNPPVVLSVSSQAHSDSPQQPDTVTAYISRVPWLRLLDACTLVLIIAHNVLTGSITHTGTPRQQVPWYVFLGTWEAVFPLYFAAELLVRLIAASTQGVRLSLRSVFDAAVVLLDIVGIVAEMLGAYRWRVLRFVGALRMYRVLFALPLASEALQMLRVCVVRWAGALFVCVLWLFAASICARHVIGSYAVPVLAREGGGLDAPMPLGNVADALVVVLRAMCGDGVEQLLYGAMRMAKAKAAASGPMSASQVNGA